MNTDKQAVIVTGSSGLIGRGVVVRLAEEFRVVGFDREGIHGSGVCLMTQEDATRVVVVNDASAGAGRAVLRAFACEGKACIGVAACACDELEAAKCEIEEFGREAFVLMADSKANEAAAAPVVEEPGSVGVWVNNALPDVFSPILTALQRILARARGVIVQAGSAPAHGGRRS